MIEERAMAAEAAIAASVGEFYERRPYPPPIDDVERYRSSWNDERRRAESHLFWPNEPYRSDRSILVAGCGTVQAAHYALRWPDARVLGIDVSAKSLAFTDALKRTHGLANLEVRRLPVERAANLRESFDYVVCTGVLHHLQDPEAGLRALRDVLSPKGALHLMLYAPYGRAGVYLLQEYCRRLGIGWGDAEIDDLAAALRALPADHPIVPLLQKSPDFSTREGIADALLHPLDRSYSVPQLLELLNSAGLAFGRWIRQAPYLPHCGAIASSPHAPALRRLTPNEQYAALELFRGTMTRHALVAHSDAGCGTAAVRFDAEAWRDYVPIRLPGTIAVRERLPAGAAAVLINRNHTDPDLYLPIDAREERMLEAIDGERNTGEIAALEDGRQDDARSFFQRLWWWDQVSFDTSASK